jgi:hypothetical protein
VIHTKLPVLWQEGSRRTSGNSLEKLSESSPKPHGDEDAANGVGEEDRDIALLELHLNRTPFQTAVFRFCSESYLV